MGFCIKVTFVHTQARFPFPCERGSKNSTLRRTTVPGIYSGTADALLAERAPPLKGSAFGRLPVLSRGDVEPLDSKQQGLGVEVKLSWDGVPCGVYAAKAT